MAETSRGNTLFKKHYLSLWKGGDARNRVDGHCLGISLDDPQLKYTSQIVLVHFSMIRLRGKCPVVNVFVYHSFGVFISKTCDDPRKSILLSE